jgi:segregation and condensation protein B
LTWDISKAVKLGADYENFKRVQDLVEATLFLSDAPIKERRLAEGLGLELQVVSEALKVLAMEYKERGIHLKDGPSGWEFVTEHKFGPQLAAFFEFQRKRRLSISALETLAVIAYHQPVTRREIDEIRGVDSSHTVRTLLEKGLIKIVGQRKTPGMPYELAVSEMFLHHFGLDSVRDLPQLEIDMDREGEPGEQMTIEAADLGITEAEVIPQEPGS